MAAIDAGPETLPREAAESATLQPGDHVAPALVQDASGKLVPLPDFGRKVLVIFYTDPDHPKLNEPFRDAVHAIHNPDKRGMGVVNIKDSWKPAWLIRWVVRKKQAKFQGAAIFLDPAHLLRSAWRLADCDGRDVVIIIGQDRVVKYLQYERMSAADIARGLQVISDLLAASQPA